MKAPDHRHARFAQLPRDVVCLEDDSARTFDRTNQCHLIAMHEVEIPDGGYALGALIAEVSDKA